jgi:pheophorbide a oxygenase
MAIALPLVSASASIVTLSSPSNKALKTTTALPFISANTPSLSSRKSPSRNLSLPRVAAPPATPTSYENQKEEEEDVDEHGEESSSSSKFSWRDHWYPVSLIEDLDPSLPTPFQLLGRDLVLWFDRSAREWVAFDDKCPHRLAPLSVTFYFILLFFYYYYYFFLRSN